MLADAELSLERYDAAARDYRLLSEQVPHDPGVWYGLERSYEGLSQQAFQTLEKSAPGSPYLSLLVADAMVARERDKSAFALYREAIAKETRARRGPRGPRPDLRACGGTRTGPPSSVRKRRPFRLPRWPDADFLEREFQAGQYARVLKDGRSRRVLPRAATGPPGPPTCWPARLSTASRRFLPRPS